MAHKKTLNPLSILEVLFYFSIGATTTLTHSRVEEFERILLLYLDFRQKQKVYWKNYKYHFTPN